MIRFIYNGGINWEVGPNFHWSSLLFAYMFIYNILRGLLLWKTKMLENYQDASGLYAAFSLSTATLWRRLYLLAQLGFYLAIAIAAINSIHFLTQEIPVNPP